jgi:hypothetical protein
MLEFEHRDYNILSMSISPQNPKMGLISSEKNELLELFDLDAEKLIKSYTSRGFSCGKNSVCDFSPCGTYVYASTHGNYSFSSSKENSTRDTCDVYFWRVDSGKQVTMGDLGSRLIKTMNPSKILKSKW